MIGIPSRCKATRKTRISKPKKTTRFSMATASGASLVAASASCECCPLDHIEVVGAIIPQHFLDTKLVQSGIVFANTPVSQRESRGR